MMKKTFNYLLFVVVASFFAIMPFVRGGYFESHDSYFHLERLIFLDNALRQGYMYPRWIQELAYGLGMPLFNFYPPFAYYYAETFHLLGQSFSQAILSVFMTGFIISGISMYLFIREIFGELPGVVGAIAYIYAPYHLLEANVRGAMPEFLAYALTPLIFYALIKASTDKRFLPLVSLSSALLIISHSITSLIVAPFIFIYLLMMKDRNRLLSFLLIGIGLSAFYWLPAIMELNYLFQSTSFHYSDHFLYPYQIFSKVWGFGLSIPGPDDKMGFGLGNIHFIFSFLALYLLNRGSGKIKRQVLFFTAMLYISLFMTLTISKPLWDIFPLAGFIQFPWRFLLPASFASSLLASGFLTLFKRKDERMIFSALLVVMFLLYVQPILYLNHSSTDKLGTYNYEDLKVKGPTTTVGGRELMPKWAAYPLSLQDQNLTWPTGTSRLDYNRYMINIYIDKHREMTFPVLFFPGWKAKINDIKTQTYPDDRGLITLSVPKGSQSILIYFEDTPSRKAGKIVSLLSLIIIVVGLYPFFRRN